MFQYVNFFTPLLEVETDNTPQEKYLHIIGNIYIRQIQTVKLAKDNNSHKIISEISSWCNNLFECF